MARKKTNEQFLQDLKEKAPDIIALEKYKTSREPIECKCKKCGHRWPAIPNNLLRGEGCPRCGGNIKKTTQQFVDELKIINPSLIVIGEYISNKSKIKYICKQCGREDEKEPSSLLQGHGCKYCARQKNGDAKRRSNEWFIEELKKRKLGIVPLEPYKTSNTKIACRCVCGDIWLASPANILQGKRCRRCMGRESAERQIWSNEEFVEKLRVINPRIEPLEEYTGIYNEIICRCKICGYVWPARARQLLKGRGCKSCQRRWQTSFPEQSLFYYIRKAFPDAINSYTDGFYPSELDIFIPSLKIGIEYDGRRYHDKVSNTELKKYNICKEKSIYLIRVRERIPDNLNEKICDLMIHSEFGDKKKNESLDKCISIVLDHLHVSIDINVERDTTAIRDQFFGNLGKKSFSARYPSIAEEWDPIKNGKITPDMVTPGSDTEYHWICPKCGRSYKASPATRAAGHGCQACAGNMRKSHSQFVSEMSERAPSILILEEYSDAVTKIRFKCLECGKEDSATPHDLLRGRRCKYCGKKKADMQKTLPEDEFIRRASECSPNVEIIGKYVSSHARIKCRCKKCGYIWEPEAHTLYDGNTGCKKCAGNKPLMIMCVETGEVFKSMYQVEKEKKINHSSLHKCLHGKGMTAGGYHWKVVNS